MKNIWSDKGATEIDVFGADWVNLLDAETISTSTWAVVSGGLTIVSQSTAGTETFVKLSGGTVGRAKMLNTVVTSGSRTLTQLFNLNIVDMAVS